VNAEGVKRALTMLGPPPCLEPGGAHALAAQRTDLPFRQRAAVALLEACEGLRSRSFPGRCSLFCSRAKGAAMGDRGRRPRARVDLRVGWPGLGGWARSRRRARAAMIRSSTRARARRARLVMAAFARAARVARWTSRAATCAARGARFARSRSAFSLGRRAAIRATALRASTASIRSGILRARTRGTRGVWAGRRRRRASVCLARRRARRARRRRSRASRSRAWRAVNTSRNRLRSAPSSSSLGAARSRRLMRRT